MFYLMAAASLSAALMVILTRKAVHSALFLVVSFLALAGVYITLYAEFLAAVQVLVYAGGVMVLYLFIIMLVNIESLPDPGSGRIARPLGVLLVLVVVAMMGGLFLSMPEATEVIAPDANGLGTVEKVGEVLYTSYVLPFEVASLFLLVAMVGAIVLARQEN